MTKRRTPWRQTTQVCLRVHFETHPDVHTFIHHAESGDICALLRDLLRAHIQQTGHRAGDPSFQKETAMAGMSHLIDQTISAAQPSPAAMPETNHPGVSAAQTPAATSQPQATTTPRTPVSAPVARETPASVPMSVATSATRQEPPAVQAQVAPAEAVPAATSPVRKPGIVGRFNDD